MKRVAGSTSVRKSVRYEDTRKPTDTWSTKIRRGTRTRANGGEPCGRTKSPPRCEQVRVQWAARI
eukprot:1485297-Prymnesium_polylepis.1